jgi:hypothetical protein
VNILNGEKIQKEHYENLKMIHRYEFEKNFSIQLFDLIKSDEMKKLLGNVGEIHTPKINPNFRRIATPPPEPHTFFDGFDLSEDLLLFSTTNTFNDKDAGMFD